MNSTLKYPRDSRSNSFPTYPQVSLSLLSPPLQSTCSISPDTFNATHVTPPKCLVLLSRYLLPCRKRQSPFWRRSAPYAPMSTTVRTRLFDLERTPGWSSFVSVPARTWKLWGLLFVKYGPTLSQVCPWPIVYVGHKSVGEKLLGFKLIGPNGHVSHALSIIIIDDFSSPWHFSLWSLDSLKMIEYFLVIKKIEYNG